MAFKKTPSGQRFPGFEHLKAIVTEKFGNKVFVRTLLKASFELREINVQTFRTVRAPGTQPRMQTLVL